MDTQIFQRYTHHPHYASNIALELCSLVAKKYGMDFAPPQKVRRGRTPRNLFLGEGRREIKMTEVNIQHTLHDAHLNDVRVTVKEGSQLYREIHKNKIDTIDGLKELLQSK